MLNPVAERCGELHCPHLALRVFGDYSKYSVKLTLPGAHHLLHSLHMEHPISDVITAAALFHVYGLTPVAEDLVSCSLVLAACLKDRSPAAIQVSNKLLPSLKHQLDLHQPPSMTIKKSYRQQPKEKPRIWLKWALKKVDKALAIQDGKRVDWLAEWRKENNHIHKGSTF